MRAAILSIGSELMEGFLTDTNATFLTQELSALGVETVGVYQVGDSQQRIVRMFRRALEDAEIIIASGGIGPTADDLTRESIAELCGESVSVDESVVDGIQRFFRSRGIEMPEQNIKQAWMIPSAESLANPMGTAPGWFVRRNGQVIASMPGVPREMRRMFTEQVIPRILPLLSGSHIVSRTLKTIGIGESAAEQAILDIINEGSPTIATYAKNDGVHIRITAVADDSAIATVAVERAEARIRDRIGKFVYGYLDTSLAEALVQPLGNIGADLGVWEAGTAGRLAGLLHDDEIASRLVANARSTSYQVAVAETGATEVREVAAETARRAADTSQAGYGASIVVEISPGDIADRDRGRVGLALAHPGGIVSREHVVTATPQEIRRRAVLWSTDFFWISIRNAVERPEEVVSS